jgi:hypothetical protein
MTETAEGSEKMGHQNSSTSSSITIEEAESVVRWIARSGILDHKDHIWTNEQQTNHKVCAWCSRCDEPGCDHYWGGE